MMMMRMRMRMRMNTMLMDSVKEEILNKQKY